MKLKNYQVLHLTDLVNKLDNPEQGKDAIKYKFKASVLFALAKNHRKLKTASEDIQRTRASLFKKYATEGEEELKGDSAKGFVKEWNEFLESETEVAVHAVKYEDLDLDTNNIPISVVSDLIGSVIQDE